MKGRRVWLLWPLIPLSLETDALGERMQLFRTFGRYHVPYAVIKNHSGLVSAGLTGQTRASRGATVAVGLAGFRPLCRVLFRLVIFLLQELVHELLDLAVDGLDHDVVARILDRDAELLQV